MRVWCFLLLLATSHATETSSAINSLTEYRKILEGFAAATASIKSVINNLRKDPIVAKRRARSLNDQLGVTSLLELSVGPSGTDGRLITDGVGILFVILLAANLVIIYLRFLTERPNLPGHTAPQSAPEPTEPTASQPEAAPPADAVDEKDTGKQLPRKLADCGGRTFLQPTALTHVPQVKESKFRISRNEVDVVRPTNTRPDRKVWKNGTMEPRHLEYSDSNLMPKHIGIVPIDIDPSTLPLVQDALSPARPKPKPQLPIPNDECDDHKNGRAPELSHAFVLAKAHDVPIEPSWVHRADSPRTTDDSGTPAPTA